MGLIPLAASNWFNPCFKAFISPRTVFISPLIDDTYLSAEKHYDHRIKTIEREIDKIKETLSNFFEISENMFCELTWITDIPCGTWKKNL